MLEVQSHCRKGEQLASRERWTNKDSIIKVLTEAKRI